MKIEGHDLNDAEAISVESLDPGTSAEMEKFSGMGCIGPMVERANTP